MHMVIFKSDGPSHRWMLYGIPHFELPKEIHPSNESVLPLSEELNSKHPSFFKLKLEISKNDGTEVTSSKKSGIHVTYEGRKIKYRFDSSYSTGDAYSSLFKSSVRVML